jgi:hypothetical protein
MDDALVIGGSHNSLPPLPPPKLQQVQNHSLIEGSEEKVRVCGGLMLVVLHQVILGQESNEAGATTLPW